MTARRNARNRTSAAAKPPLPDIDLDGLNAFFVDREGSYETVYRVSVRTGLPEATVRNWWEKRNAPSLLHGFVIADVYGVGALAAMWPGIAPQWLSESVRAARAAELELRIREDKARLDALKGAA